MKFLFGWSVRATCLFLFFTLATIGSSHSIETQDTGMDQIPVSMTLSTVSGIEEEIVLVPIITSDLTGLDLEAFEFDIRFDPLALEALGFSRAGSLLAFDEEGSSPYSISFNSIEPGLVKVIGFWGGTGEQLSGAGTFLNLKFRIRNLTGSDLTWQSLILDEGKLPSVPTNGRVNVTPCDAVLTPTSENFSAAGGAGSINIDVVPNGCSWTASTASSWVQLASGGPTVGDGAANYSVAQNIGPARSATVQIFSNPNTRILNITQASGCTSTVSPGSATLAATGGDGTFTLGSSDPACQWTATSDQPWLSVTSGAGGTGGRTVGFSAAANAGPERGATITVGNSVFNVTQENGCSYLINPASSIVSGSAGSGSFGISTSVGCVWTAVSNNSFITTTSSGSGNGTVTFNYSLNDQSNVPRTGTISVAGSTFTLTQSGCSVSLNPTNVSNLSGTGATGSFSVNAETGCNWSATSNSPWISVTSGTQGVGTGTVVFSVDTDPGVGRTGSISVGDQTFTVNQSPNCAVATIAPLEGVSGSLITLPVAINNVATRGVISYDLTFNYDSVNLEFIETVTRNSVTAGFNTVANSSSLGTIVISAIGRPQITNNGSLVGLKFRLKGLPSSSANVQIQSLILNQGQPCVESTVGPVAISITGVGISGDVVYFGSPTNPVNDVSLSLSGTNNRSVNTGASGGYEFEALPSGTYTVTPSKTGGVNGIQSLDAALIAQFSVGLIDLSPEARIAADVTGNGSINSLDAARIAQYLVGIPVESLVGTWKFTPASKSYSDITADVTGERFTAILMGDVSGSWSAPASVGDDLVSAQTIDTSNRFEPSVFFGSTKARGLTEEVGISLPSEVGVAQDGLAEIPILLSNLAKGDIIGFDLQIDYDPELLEPIQPQSIVTPGLATTNFVITTNSPRPGTLLVSGFSTTPITVAGEMLKLRFRLRSDSPAEITLRDAGFNETLYVPLRSKTVLKYQPTK